MPEEPYKYRLTKQTNGIGDVVYVVQTFYTDSMSWENLGHKHNVRELAVQELENRREIERKRIAVDVWTIEVLDD